MVTHLLVHGFAGSPVGWARVIPRLDGNAVAPALPGHNGPALASFDAYVEWLAGEAARWPRPLHLVGYSAGGRIVAGALAKGVGCDFATLISTHLGLGSETERGERIAADARWSALLRQHGMAAFIDAWEAQPVFASQRHLPAAELSDQTAVRDALVPSALADAMDALSLGRMPDLAPAMRALRLPWQLVVGRLDDKFMALSRGAGAPRVTELPCGHNPLLEAPKALAGALNEFVSGQGSPSSH